MYEDDRDILNYKVGNLTLEGMTGITFMQWVADKLNNVPTYEATSQELIQMVSNPIMGQVANDQKIDVFRKMLKINIPL